MSMWSIVMSPITKRYHKKVHKKGTSTGVVATTTPVLKRPIHRRFTKKREKGRCFIVYLLFYAGRGQG